MEHIYYSNVLFLSIFLIICTLIPKIRKLSLKLNLTDVLGVPNTHNKTVPSFGGHTFYSSHIIALFFIHFFFENQVSFTAFAGLYILFSTRWLDAIVSNDAVLAMKSESETVLSRNQKGWM
jgi:UDP-N-acetylmuramyl pentapeptide phosphotransferase/UDP-N-acetylglucosamine-1-phosphate transferase|tara:strand:+ start:278 stop:640 length:363 start_codon:yes stop_codon:yes gene_type:complete